MKCGEGRERERAAQRERVLNGTSLKILTNPLNQENLRSCRSAVGGIIQNADR